MSAQIIDLGHRRLKQQLAGSLALLEAANVSVEAGALEPSNRRRREQPRKAKLTAKQRRQK